MRFVRTGREGEGRLIIRGDLYTCCYAQKNENYRYDNNNFVHHIIVKIRGLFLSRDLLYMSNDFSAYIYAFFTFKEYLSCAKNSVTFF